MNTPRNVVEEFVSTMDVKGDEAFDELLGYVLAKTRRFTLAEAGTIFVCEPLLSGKDSRTLRCVSAQNDKIDVSTASFTIPINDQSIAGYTANHGTLLNIDDLYLIPDNRPYEFNQSFDKKDGYRSMSMLSVPLKNIKNEVIGVVQLLNRLGDDVDTYSVFSEEDAVHMEMLSLIIGMMVERSALVEEIKRFQAAVRAEGGRID